MAIPLGRSLPNASRDLPGGRSGNGSPALPIWSCSRWGLPCHLGCPSRGALLPHHFNLAAAKIQRTAAGRRCHFCGAVPGVAPGGRYPSPCFRGARTFLEPLLSQGPAAIRPSDAPQSYVIPGQRATRARAGKLRHGANAFSTAARAWISVVSNSGMAVSFGFTSKGISVQPRITPSAPCAARRAMISR